MSKKYSKQYIKSFQHDTLSSLSHHQDKNYDTIKYRLEFVQKLLDNNKLQNIVDYSRNDTENFINYQDNEKNNNDTRRVLNKKLYNFYDIINSLGGKLQFVKSGSTGHLYRCIINTDGKKISFAIKVSAYPKRAHYGDIHNITRPENCELMIIKLLSYFVVNNQTPHIVLPIATFDCNIKPFVNLDRKIVDKYDAKNKVFIKNKKYDEFVKKYKDGQYDKHVSVLITEWTNRSDFLDFLRRFYKQFTLTHWKVFFFQIISALGVVQSRYPTFRHNDMKCNNILVHKIDQRGNKFEYTVCDKKYIIPSVGYILKLTDFDFASIDGVIDNSKVNAEWTNRINISSKQNKYYDLHYFFNTLHKRGFFPELMMEDIIPQEVKDFINEVVPKKYRKGDYVRFTQRAATNLINSTIPNKYRNKTYRKLNKSKQLTLTNQLIVLIHQTKYSNKSSKGLKNFVKQYIIPEYNNTIYRTIKSPNMFNQVTQITTQKSASSNDKIIVEWVGGNVSHRGRILVNDEYLTPDTILKKSPFFAEFRIK